MSSFDNHIKDELNKRAKEESLGLKEEIWSELEQELFENDKKGGGRKMKKRRLPLFIAIAAGLLIVLSFQTNTGTAFIKGIKDMFASEKEIVQSIEGQEEETEVQLNEGTNSEYILYIDETRYKMIQGENADVVTTIEPLPEKFPEVTMEIKQIPNEKPEDLVKKVEAELKKEFPELRAIENVTEPVDGFLLHGLNGNDWDAKVVHAYVISNGKEGSFVIRENYFLEAAEGHGARFHHMLESFEIVDN